MPGLDTAEPTLVTAQRARPDELPTWRKLTRAHRALAERPDWVAAAQTLATSISESLSRLLGWPVHLNVRLRDDVRPVHAPVSSLGVVATFELAHGERMELELDRSFASGLLRRLAAGEGELLPASRLTPVEEAALGYLLLVSLAATRGHGIERALSPRLLSLDGDARSALAHIGGQRLILEARVEAGPLKGLVRLLVPPSALQRVLDVAPLSPSGPIPDSLLAAEVALSPRLGRCLVSSSELQTLRPGDVVCFDDARWDGDALAGDARWVCSTFELAGALVPEGFVFHRASSCASLEVTDVSRSDAAPPGLAPAALPIELEVELARIRIPIAELAQLEPGRLVRLRVGTHEPVLLKVGARAVARAELIDVEGELGARVLSLLA
jgi:type III secretion protein Q